MGNKTQLRLDWASHEAAKWAVEHWHYSCSMPSPPVVKLGVWENDDFIGAVLFSRGASSALGGPYGLKMTEVCELTRVALSAHVTPVTRIIAIAIRVLCIHSPGLRLIVSFADPNHAHHGGIYQGGNWIYTGTTPRSVEYIANDGKRWHTRQVSVKGYNKQYGEYRRVPKPEDLCKIDLLGKHRYLMPLDDSMCQQVKSLAQPYPKRAKHSGDAVGSQSAEGGSIPTCTLQSNKTAKHA